jgi:hypothetical protein
MARHLPSDAIHALRCAHLIYMLARDGSVPHIDGSQNTICGRGRRFHLVLMIAQAARTAIMAEGHQTIPSRPSSAFDSVRETMIGLIAGVFSMQTIHIGWVNRAIMPDAGHSFQQQPLCRT